MEKRERKKSRREMKIEKKKRNKQGFPKPSLEKNKKKKSTKNMLVKKKI